MYIILLIVCILYANIFIYYYREIFYLSYTKLYKIYKCNYKLTLLTLNLAYNSNDK